MTKINTYGTVMVVGSVIGAVLLSLNIPASKWGYVFFLISSLSGIMEGIHTKVYSLVMMSAFFVLTNLVGIYRWVL